MKIKIIIILFSANQFISQVNNNPSTNSEIINIGSRLELFTDYFLIDSLKNTELRLHHPIDKGSVLKFDNPWEGQFSGYCTVIDNGEKFQLFYRGLPTAGKDGRIDENTCYAESVNGIKWVKPNLKIYEVDSTFKNNVILANAAPVTHNFSPFFDTRKDVTPNYKYKALGGTQKSGLIAYVSKDGIHWNKLQEKSVFGDGVFDSQNVSFWSEEEQSYICYFRTWTKDNYSGFRTVSRTTSKDFINWTKPVKMDFGESPIEHLYTNQTAPYYRAPHIYISVAARFLPNRQVLTNEQALELNVNPKYFKDCSDAILMTSRGGNKYDRTFMDGFIRPGIGLQNWVSRSNYPALNIVQTSPTEMSIYVNQDYAQPTAHIRRYALRLDGFISVHSSYKEGEMITKPFYFTGNHLVLNFSTSAAGFIKVEILDKDGRKIKGFELENSKEIIGNEIEKVVMWKGNANLNKLSSKPISLRFLMKDADLYSIRFK
ncbi:MAG: hypothetical protein V3V16_14375 [Melioribacteraceae bacterium]